MRHDVQSVTTAHAGRHEDLAARQRRYLWMMGIRVACLPLAIMVDGWARWFFIVGAVFLPYFAVVVANAVSRPSRGTLTPVQPSSDRALPAATTPERSEN